MIFDDERSLRVDWDDGGVKRNERLFNSIHLFKPRSMVDDDDDDLLVSESPRGLIHTF